MSHDDIRAALEAATRQPWVVLYPGQCCEGYCIESEDGRDAVAHGLEGSVSDLDLITSAPTWLAELLDEVDRLTDELDRLRLSDAYMPEGVDIVMAKLRDHKRRAESAEQWKTEALPVIDGLQELGAALGLPLGKRITGPDALEAVKALAARAEAAEATVRRVRRLAEAWATQPTDYDEDTEQQIEDGRAILHALDGGEH